jgi:hypothetical protein
LNFVIIRNIDLGSTPDWIDWCRYYGFKKALLSQIAVQGSYKSIYPNNYLVEMVRQFKVAGITVGLHCLSQCIDRSISSYEFIKDSSGNPIVIRGYYVPREGSELFFQVAQNLAEFYNLFGFDGGIYFDGIDYFATTTKRSDCWSLLFLAKTLLHCRKPCPAECSMPGILNSKYLDYIGAEDQPAANFRAWVDAHMQRNDLLQEMVGELKIENLGFLSLNRLPEPNDLTYFLQKVRERDAIYGCVLPVLDPPQAVEDKMEVLRLFNTFAR